MRILILALVILAGSISAAWPDQVPKLVAKLPELESSKGLLQQGDIVFLNVRKRDGANHQLIALSLTTLEVRVVADNIPDFRVLAARDHQVAIAELKTDATITIIDLPDLRSRSICCVKRAWQGYFAGNELRVLDQDGGRLDVTRIDPVKGTIDRITNLAVAGKLAPWGDKLVAVEQRRSGTPKLKSEIVIYDNALDRSGETEIPPAQVRGNLGCRVDHTVVGGSRLVYVSDCGHINIVDLEKPAHEHMLPYFSQATFYGLAIDGDLLFVRPHQTGEPISVFRLTDGLRLAEIPIDAREFVVSGNRMVVRDADGRIAVYDLDLAGLGDVARARADVLSACRAAQQLPKGTPAAARLAAIESTPVAPLLVSLETLDAEGFACVHAYARQLARSIDRIAEGLVLLERLLAIHPDDSRIPEEIAAARGHLALTQTANAADLAVLRSARELTIGAGARGLGPDILLSGSRLIAWQWGDLGGVCATLTVSDRKTLEIEKFIPIADCDDEFQDSISSVVEGPNHLYVALEYRFKQEGRTDLVVLHGDGLGLMGRYHLMGGISRLIPSEEGLITCPRQGECVVRDWNNVEAPVRTVSPFVCPPQRTYGPPVLRTPPVLPKSSGGGFFACSESFAALRLDRGENAAVKILDLADPEPPLFTASVAWPIVAIDEERHRAVISATNVETVEFKTLDLASGVARPELSLLHDKEGGLPWAIHGDLLFVGRSHDLVIHDVAQGKTLAYVKDLITPGREHSSKSHRIEHLIVDRDYSRLIVLTRDGHWSRAISLGDLEGAFTNPPPTWSTLDAVLTDDHAE